MDVYECSPMVGVENAAERSVSRAEYVAGNSGCSEDVIYAFGSGFVGVWRWVYIDCLSVVVHVEVDEVEVRGELCYLAVVFHGGFVCVQHEEYVVFVIVLSGFSDEGGEVGEKLFVWVRVLVSCCVEDRPLLSVSCAGSCCGDG